jgi:hypothetical protein
VEVDSEALVFGSRLTGFRLPAADNKPTDCSRKRSEL